jgi:sulfopyruvate decarboxylase TPP-binding subunit
MQPVKETILVERSSALTPDWPDRIHAVFKRHNIRQVGYVPDHGLTRLIELCCQDNAITDVVLTTEAEGPALALGATLGGERAALMMQSSGVGNCINAFSLLRNCAVPCIILVTMRGEFNDFNPWQVPMGSITEPTLKLAGFQTYRVDAEADVEPTVESACRMAFGGGNMQIAVLLSQRMVDRSHQGR